MKNIKTIILAACAVTLALASCRDDNDTTAQHISVISVTSTSFEATGGTDTIVVDRSIASAYTNAAWATVTTGNASNTVYVTAATNNSKESRHGIVVIKSAPADSTIVDIDQLGSVFSTSLPKSLVLNDDAQTKSYSLSATGTSPRSQVLPTGSQPPSTTVPSASRLPPTTPVRPVRLPSRSIAGAGPTLPPSRRRSSARSMPAATICSTATASLQVRWQEQRWS